MSYGMFVNKVSAIAKRAGNGIKVRFSKDEENGRYFAKCSDGTTIIGNASSLKVTVRFGSGHQAVAAI